MVMRTDWPFVKLIFLNPPVVSVKLQRLGLSYQIYLRQLMQLLSWFIFRLGSQNLAFRILDGIFDTCLSLFFLLFVFEVSYENARLNVFQYSFVLLRNQWCLWQLDVHLAYLASIKRNALHHLLKFHAISTIKLAELSSFNTLGKVAFLGNWIQQLAPKHVAVA